ncbi:hypothetical protein BATDEDRAFT_91148 [Batrachochytrium dendrobatidis JAM81]|uniref:RCC1-like domain-containing protein n=1 Tax=Batrachochytrium dendrobatidis (strain JAM81 / FGSC 10211) TaxID=684364 RepID=F4PAB0_BATDJ|nr:uncharacterized protein BATDEDRAFT_91148 [Batrachochytrium dendrobatidis JAM81]EGF78033.1 hypothetical protein BATDEDRAFT_91148 [Batrachochytrium dendrobatidis JAM81]|eukprot:XP_006681553.1 hypothetical protein BATDEDRAFT_91148 [Batrachochytrium dendrobatidis JAM81]
MDSKTHSKPAGMSPETSADISKNSHSTGGLVFCGATIWDWVGRKSSTNSKTMDFGSHEFPAPHIYGAAAYINVVDVFSHCTSAHAVIIDDQGAAYTFGRNQNGQLGDGTTTSRSDPFRINIKGETFVKAAVGKAHTLLVTASGRVYAAGENKVQQCGVKAGVDIKTFVQVTAIKGQHAVDVACGLDFSLAITEDGTLFAWGSPQYGQLGDGKDHSYISGTSRMIYDPQMPKPITKLEDKKIVAIACGTNHSLALDDQGAVYSWGCGGYGRLGLPDSPPKDIFVPTEVPGFKDRNNMVKKIACGTTSCMAIDGRNALYLWGKWKQSGDGGQGTPWLYPKHYPGLSGWEVWEISAGGSTLFALAGESTVSWGQNAYHGELGHGPNAPRSCVNADIVKGMEGISCKKVSCGLGFTLMVADKSSKPFADLPAIGELITTSPFAEVSTPAATKKVAAGTKAKAPAAKGKRKTSDEPGKDAADALVADAELTTKPKKGRKINS